MDNNFITRNFKLLLILISLTVCVKAQTIKSITPTGGIRSVSPSVTINNTSSETEIFRDTILSKTLIPYRFYPFEVHLALTTPVVSTPTVTIKVYLGSQVISTMNGALMVGGLTNAPLILNGNIIARTNTSQVILMSVTQPQGSAVNMTFGNTEMRANWTANSQIDNIFRITIQVTGINLGATTISTDWIYRKEF